MMHMNLFLSLGVLLALGGCSPSSYIVENISEGQSSFCEVAEDFDKYRGVEVELSARYVSDGKHEEVLEASCRDGRRVIDIGRRGSSDSVEKFYAERKRICSERGASYLCNTSAKVDVLGTISIMSGDFVIDVKEVRRFAFEE